MLDFRGFNEFVRFQSKHVEGKSRGMFYLRFILHCQNSVELFFAVITPKAKTAFPLVSSPCDSALQNSPFN
jgi:hypothetical protein